MTTEFEGYSKLNFSLAEVANFDGQQVPNQIAIEGNVGSGKSTVAVLFGQQYGYPHIGEYGNYVDFPGGEKFPIFPPKAELDVVSSNLLWMKLEFRRQKHMVDSMRVSDKKILLVERSPLSLMAFEYAKMKLGFSYEISNLTGNYAMLVQTDHIKEPLGYVFLNVSPATVAKRIAERGGRSIGFLFDPTTCRQIEHFFTFFKQTYLKQTPYVDIQTDDKKPEIVAQEIRTFLDSSQDAINAQPFNRFCLDVLTEKIIFEQI